jgi:hypothetical protein
VAGWNSVDPYDPFAPVAFGEPQTATATKGIVQSASAEPATEREPLLPPTPRLPGQPY